jgi:acylphosphatase
MNNQNIKVHIFISGRVQGVFFRQFTQKKAQELGLVGWVKNLADGRVEAVIEGDKEKIDKLLTYLKQGPPLSKVENVKIDYQKHQEEFKDFSILC